MNGQWIGTYSGTNTGNVVADLDDVGTNYAGVVFPYDSNSASPITFASVELPKHQSQVSLRVRLQAIIRGTGERLTPDTVAKRFSGLQMATHADTESNIAPNEISLKWKTEIGETNWVGKMRKSEGASPSTLTAHANVKSWDDFKKFVLNLQPYRFAFRGHENNTWRLRTSFHRTGRASLTRFWNQDVHALHRHLSGLTTHRYRIRPSQHLKSWA
jgi:hypothetical protein